MPPQRKRRARAGQAIWVWFSRKLLRRLTHSNLASFPQSTVSSTRNDPTSLACCANNQLRRVNAVEGTRMRQQAWRTLTRHGWMRYDRRLSICSGKDNKEESAATIAEPPFEQF